MFVCETEKECIVFFRDSMPLHLVDDFLVLPFLFGSRKHLAVLWQVQVVVIPPLGLWVLIIVELSGYVGNPYGVRAESMDELGKLVLDKLRSMKGVMRTVTCVCFNTLKE
jgi:hypothetical protein